MASRRVVATPRDESVAETQVDSLVKHSISEEAGLAITDESVTEPNTTPKVTEDIPEKTGDTLYTPDRSIDNEKHQSE
jgi:hypothetical protein